MDEDNFHFTIGTFNVVMTNGELEINGASYDPLDKNDDPTWMLVVEVARHRGLIK